MVAWQWVLLIVFVPLAVGVAYGYYKLLLRGWIRKYRHPQYRRWLAVVFGVLVYIFGVCIVFLERVRAFLGNLGLPSALTDWALLIVAVVLCLVGLIAYLIVLGISRGDQIKH